MGKKIFLIFEIKSIRYYLFWDWLVIIGIELFLKVYYRVYNLFGVKEFKIFKSFFDLFYVVW